MDMTIPKLFNEKIAVKQVTEEIKGSIILPQNRVLKFEMGEVLATGDGQYRDGTKRDVIARLSALTITKETFEIIGNWVLLEIEVDQGLIIVAKEHAPAEEFKFIVRQIGQGVKLPLVIGEMCFPERGKCLPVEIDGVTYVYTHQDFIHGALTNVPVSDVVIEDAVPSPSATAP